MLIDKIKIGVNPPEEVNVIIEIPMLSSPVKYELDKDSGAMFVDRFIQSAMCYPCNYGFIPHTKARDGDPIDCLVVTQYPLITGCVVPVRPIAVLLMEDESGLDEKIITVPLNKLDPFFTKTSTINDLGPTLQKKIEHFFKNYKDLDQGKWTKIIGWGDLNKAKELINQAINNSK